LTSDLPARDRTILRRHMTDVVAARFAGAACPEGRAVAALCPQGEGADRVAGLAALVRLTETDDIHISSCTTPSSVAVPVALGLAAQTPCGPAQLESAIFVGTELIVRLGLAIGGADVLYQGLWPTRTGATLGAAAVACRIWGLSEAQTRHALSLAAMLTSGRTGRFLGEPSGRWFIFAAAVAAGIRAASAARCGFTGDPAVFDASWLERSLGVPVDVQKLVGNLGGTSVFPELSLKPYCTSRQALPGAEAMRALVARGLDPASIISFAIKVPSAYAPMISQQLDVGVRASAYVSGAGLAAIAALDPSSLYDVERTSVLTNPDITELARKGEITADPELDRLYPARWPARIEVRTSSSTLHHEVIEPIGDPGNPLSDREFEDKLRRVLTHAGRADTVDEVLKVSANAFESEASVSAVSRVFVDGRTA
jgi:2-methylcitrate dehydratase PrpD